MLHSADAELKRERLGEFLHRLAPMATIFGLAEAWAASAHDDPAALRAALVVLLYSGVVLVAARTAVGGASGVACALASSSTLAAALILVFVQPWLYATLSFAPLLAAIIAYPYLAGRPLALILGSSLVATAAIALIGARLLDTAGARSRFELALGTGGATAMATLVAYFLWQYRQQIESSLRGAEGRSAQLELAIAELSGRERAARWLALRDPLTGVANRRLLLDRLEEALRDPLPDDRLAALLFVDLDGFKRINDELGHDRGDRLLVDVARVLQEAVRKTDTLARFGGDEFALLMPRVATAFEPEQVAARLLSRLARDLEPLPAGMRVTASVGLALSPDHGATPEELLRAADAAMYRAKLAGGEQFAWPRPTELPTLVAGAAEIGTDIGTTGR